MHKSRGHNNLFGKRQPPSIIRGPHSFMRLQKATTHTLVRLTLKRAEVFHVPRPGRFFVDSVLLALP